MKKGTFLKLLKLNTEAANALESMTKAEMATIKGGKTFMNLHRTDMKIAEAVEKYPKLYSIIERGRY